MRCNERQEIIKGIAVCNPVDIEKDYLLFTVDYAAKMGFNHMQIVGPIHDAVKGNIDGVDEQDLLLPDDLIVIPDQKLSSENRGLVFDGEAAAFHKTVKIQRILKCSEQTHNMNIFSRCQFHPCDRDQSIALCRMEKGAGGY